MTRLAFEHLYRRILLFASLAVMLTGVVVALVGIVPLVQTLRTSAHDSLGHSLNLRALAVTQQVESLSEVTRQVTSRSVIRDHLAAYLAGNVTLQDLRDFTAPRLDDARRLASGAVAIVRVDPQGTPLVAVGTETIPEALTRHFETRPGEVALDGPLFLSEETAADGVFLRLLASAPILGPDGALLGGDVVVFEATALAEVLGLRLNGGESFRTLLGVPISPEDPQALTWYQAEGGLLRAVTPPVPLVMDPDFRGVSVFEAVNGIDWVVASGLVEGSGWRLAVMAPVNQLYSRLWQVLLVVGVAVLVLVATGILVLLVVLRPLSGHIIVNTRELQDKVDDLKRLGDELAAERIRLKHSNAELEEFAYAASHDLQQPLRMISGFLDLLQRRNQTTLDAESKEYLTYAADGADRLRAMIQGLLEYSRIGKTEAATKPVNLGGAAAEALLNLKARLEDCGATIDLPPLPTVLAHHGQMVRLFQNLFDNALKYSKPGEAPQITVEAEQTGAFWHIKISDNGLGLNENQSVRAFRLFQRLHPESQQDGHGLGLPLCHKIVESHGGSIWLESAVGQGLTVHFTLPAA